ncbi:MAG: SIMPL domain-containing protein [Bacteroidales bacterium]|nr:SIMPL domain-containing protein [Bacteroidales bacterium]
MKRISFFIAFIATTSNLVLGQAAGNYFYNQSKSKSEVSGGIFDEANYRGYVQQNQYYPTTVSSNDTAFMLECNAIMNVKADEYVMILGTSQIAESLEDCHQMLNKRIENFKQAIQPLGIASSDIYVDYISQFPIFEIEVEKKLFSKTYHEVPTGYELKKNIHIHYKNKEIAEKIMLEAAKNEIYDIIKVDYMVLNTNQIYDSLRQICIKSIQKKVNELQKLGVKTESQYQLVYENMQSTYPLERYSSYVEFARYNSNSSKMGSKVISHYNVPALFYNPLNYKNYECIVNPIILEPVVQFSYNLKVKYVLKKR